MQQQRKHPGTAAGYAQRVPPERTDAAVQQARDFLSPAQLADLLGVSAATIYRLRYARRGPPAYRIGGQVRFRREDVEAWLAERRDHEVIG